VQKVHDGARVNVIAAEPAAVPAGSPLPQR
jgi:hypothetical protein